MYSSSDDDGQSWSSAERIWNGIDDYELRDPCVAVDQYNRPWVFATHTYVNIGDLRFGWLWGFRRAGEDDWDELVRELWSGYSIGPPSMVVSSGRDDAVAPGGGLGQEEEDDAPMAYVVVPYERWDIGQPTGERWLWFYAVDDAGIRYECELAHAYSPDELRGSIDFLPGDDIHVVYQSGLPRLYHRFTQAPGGPSHFRNGGTLTWSDPMRVSRDQSEPASFPSLCADGDVLTAAWQAPGPTSGQETWTAKKELWQPGSYWSYPAFLSEDDDYPAGHPSVASRIAASFHEATEAQVPFQEEVLLKCYDFWNASQTPDGGSVFPHTFAYASAPPAPLVIHTYSLWTEFPEGGGREVAFQYRQFVPMDGPQARPSYLLAFTGQEEASVYCLERTGYRVYRNHAVDYGGSALRYRLPYLDPFCEYVLEVSAYHEAGSAVEYVFAADGNLLRRVLVEPGECRTLYLRLPKQSYGRDFAVELAVSSPSGAEVGLADGIRAYRLPAMPGFEGGQGRPTGSAGQPLTVRCLPNPVADRLKVEYSFASPGMTRIWVNNVSGRAVGQLAQRQDAPGTHVETWSGRDAAGNRLPAGIYFINVRHGAESVSERVALTR